MRHGSGLEEASQGVAIARQRLAEIAGRRGELEQRRREIQTQREELAYDAEFDPDTKKKLERLIDEGLRVGAQAEDLAAAAREADRRLSVALANEQQETVRAKAHEAAALIPVLRQAGDDASLALATFLEKFEEVYRISHRIRALVDWR